MPEAGEGIASQGFRLQLSPHEQLLVRSAEKHTQKALRHAIEAHYHAVLAHVREAKAHICTVKPYLLEKRHEMGDHQHEVWAHLLTAKEHVEKATVHGREKERLLEAQAVYLASAVQNSV